MAIKFLSTVAVDTNVLYVDAAANKVGIGTTSPSQKLHVDGSARVTGAYYDSGNAPGTANQLLASTATGTAWIDPSTIVAEAATLVVIACKNTSGATIAQGTPVYQTGTVGATATIEIAPADALISANKLPAIGLLQTALNNNGFGNVVITGELTNFTTDPIDGLTPTVGDKVFVKSGGGLTLTKPTGEGNGIQNMGLVGKVSGGNAGSITVSSIMRTNDVPNLPEGRIWVGDGNTIVSDTVYIDEPNNRFGIGTTSPSSKLNVSSTSFNDHITLTRSSDELGISVSGGQLMLEGGASPFNNNDTDLGRSDKHWREAFVYSLRSGGALQFKTSGNNEKMRIDSSGNVGIGTTSPSAKLHVNGDAKIGNLRLVSAGDADYIQSDTNIRFSPVGTSSGTRMTILSTGNVGIGTTSPSKKLDIAGDVKLTNSNSIYWRNAANNADVPLLNLSSNNTFNIGTTSSSVPVQMALHTAGSERMRITSTGNVGIGTTNPATKLDVRGDITITNANGGNPTDAGSLYFTEAAGVWGSTQYGFRINQQGTSNYLNFQSANTTTVRDILTLARDTGNVGIGTTSPGHKLEVFQTGNSLSIGDNTNAQTYMSFANTRTMVGYSGANALIQGGSGKGIQFNVNDDTFNSGEAMRITSAGNVGIGTTSPLAKLQVNSITASTMSQVAGEAHIVGVNHDLSDTQMGTLNLTSTSRDAGTNNQALGPSLTFSQNASKYVDGYEVVIGGIKTELMYTGNMNKSSIMNFYTHTNSGLTPKMSIDADGNVGIGTTAPSTPLHINNAAPTIRLQDSSSGDNHYLTGNNGEFRVQTSGYMTMRPGNTVSTTFLANGNVGIGTTSPKAKLDVAGGVKVANDTDTATADKEGTLRYRLAPDVPKSQSMVDMCMKTGPSSYAWVNIVTNTWSN